MNRYALLIGNDRYRELTPLEYPRADLDALKAQLEDPSIGGFSSVEVLWNPDLGSAQAAIGQLLAGRERDDLVLFYFSGCARRDQASDALYLELAGSRHDLLRGTAIPAGFITSELDASGAGRQVLILDCRYFADDIDTGPVISAEDFGGGSRPEPADSPDLQADGYGRVTLSACIEPYDYWQGNQVIDGAPRSLFTELLIEGLANREVAGGSEGLTVEQLYHWLHRQLLVAVADSDDPLTPERFVHHQIGELVIAGKPRSSAPSPARSEPDSTTVPELDLSSASALELTPEFASEPTPEPTPAAAPQDAPMRPEDLLPDELIKDLKAEDPRVRIGGVRELVELLQEPSLNLAIRVVLRGHLQSETDEAVRAEVEAGLTGASGPRSSAPVVEDDDADSEDLSIDLSSVDLDTLDSVAGEAAGTSAETSTAGAGQQESALKPGPATFGVDSKGDESSPPPPTREDSQQVSPGPRPTDAEVVPRYPRRLPSWLQPKRKDNAWVTWVLAGALGLVVVLASGFFFWSQIGPMLTDGNAAKRLAEEARAASAPAPLSLLVDKLAGGGRAPEMVVIPPGSFMMGSTDRDPNRNWDERSHPVEITKGYAIGRSEVTFEEYDRFAEATGRPLPRSMDPNRGARPVVEVTWYDAMAYADWLSAQTGARYRLPTEAEWEYAASAGGKVSAAVPDCGSSADGAHETGEVTGSGARSDCADTAANGSTANPWGLRYMAGNVWEWTCSLYVRSYNGTEKTCAGKSVDEQKEQLRAIRGGSRVSHVKWLRATSRDTSRPSGRSRLLGFRLLRELDQPPAGTSSSQASDD